MVGTKQRYLGFWLAIVVILSVCSLAVNAQTRQELCQKYSGTADPRIYSCCIAGIEDYDACIAYTSGGSGETNPQPRVRVYRPPPVYYSNNGRQFESVNGKDAYEALAACRKSGQTECQGYSRILQNAFAKFNAAMDACHGYKRCIDEIPGYDLDDIMKAGEYARTDVRLPVAPKATVTQVTPTRAPLETKIIPTRAPQETRVTPTMSNRYEDLKKKAVISSQGVTKDAKNNPLPDAAALGPSMPIVRTEKAFPALKAGQALSFSLRGSYMGEGLLTTDSDIEGGMLTIDAVDGNSMSTAGIKAGFEKDIWDKMPINLKVEQGYKIGVSGTQTEHFNEALFKWEVAHISDKKYRAYYMTHFGPDGVWKPLPQILDYCDQMKCSYISDPQELGYYAIVQETHNEYYDESYFLAATLLGIGAALLITGVRYWMTYKQVRP